MPKLNEESKLLIPVFKNLEKNIGRDPFSIVLSYLGPNELSRTLTNCLHKVKISYPKSFYKASGYEIDAYYVKHRYMKIKDEKEKEYIAKYSSSCNLNLKYNLLFKLKHNANNWFTDVFVEDMRYFLKHCGITIDKLVRMNIETFWDFCDLDFFEDQIVKINKTLPDFITLLYRMEDYVTDSNFKAKLQKRIPYIIVGVANSLRNGSYSQSYLRAFMRNELNRFCNNERTLKNLNRFDEYYRKFILDHYYHHFRSKYI